MILIRVEPTSIGPMGMDASARKEKWLSGFPESHKTSMRASYEKRGMGDIVGCWFSPALSRTEGQLDALTYTNEIIGPDHNFEGSTPTGLRVIALKIDDEDAERYRVSNLDTKSYARTRSANPEKEYLVPKDMPEAAQQILTLEPGEKLTEDRYLSALATIDPVPTMPTRSGNVASIKRDIS